MREENNKVVQKDRNTFFSIIVAKFLLHIRRKRKKCSLYDFRFSVITELVKSQINLLHFLQKYQTRTFLQKLQKTKKKNFYRKRCKVCIQKAYEKQQYSTVPVVKVNLIYALKTVLKFIMHNIVSIILRVHFYY